MHHQIIAAAVMAAFRRGDLTAARRLALQQLESAGSFPLLHHLLGIVECRLGRAERGVGHLCRAVEGEPENSNFRASLARALIDAGRAREAMAVADASATSPVELWLLRAEAAFAAGDRAAESLAWEAICRARPNDYRLWTNLARSLLAQNRFAEAEEAYRRALALSPMDVSALHELGLTLERLGAIDALAEMLEGALASGIPTHALAEVWTLLELKRGRTAEACELLRNQPQAADPVRWNRLRVRAYDAAGDAPAAFQAAVAMNRAVPGREKARAAAAAYRAELRQLATAITPEWAARLPRLDAAARVNVGFLVGFPRSGTTLADTFLLGHANCAVIEEQPLLVDSAAILGPTAKLERVEPKALSEVRDSYIRQLSGLAETAGSKLVIDKFPLNLLAAPWIHCLFRGAPVIFVQRHPCDAVLSGFMQSFEPNVGMASFLDLADAADFYDAVMRVWEAARASLALDVHTLVYEDLVRDPEAALRPLLGALGLEWDERLLDHRSTAHARGPLLNTSYNQVTEALSHAASGRWRRYEKQLEPVLPVLLPWADRLGYEHSGGQC